MNETEGGRGGLGTGPTFGRLGAVRPAPQRPPSSLKWLAPSGMVDLSFLNAILKIATLGIYQFWGKTEVRKKIWSGVRIDGEPLQYTGTGKEMFLGFLFVFGVVLLPLLLLSVGMAALPPAGQVIGQFVMFAVYTFLFGVGTYRAQRYRLTRTNWRGIRGTLVGSPWYYGWTYLWTAALIPLTLGWIYPWRAARLQRLVVDNMRFGDRSFRFDENAGPLYTRFIVLWLGGLASLAAFGFASYYSSTHFMIGNGKTAHLSPEGVALMFVVIAAIYLLAIAVTSWYRATQFNHFAKSTSFEGVSFIGTMTGGGLLWMALSNFALTVVTFGVMAPVVQARSAGYFIKNLQFGGAMPFEQIAQRAAESDSQGEGLAQAFDFDAF